MNRFYPLLCFALLLAVAGTAAAQQPAPSAAQNPNSFDSNSSQAVASEGANVSVAEPTPGPSQPTEPDPLLDVPPLPKGPVTLVGGTVKSIDRIRNRVAVQTFGGGTMNVSYDERTHIFRDGIETTQLGMRKGDRVYVDTMLDGPRVFARNIRVQSAAHPADASGQILSFDQRSGIIRLRDQLLGQAVVLRVGENTVVTQHHQPARLTDLKPGALVSVKFLPFRANSGSARSIDILATPGTPYSFAGKVTHIDLRMGLLSLENQTDKQTYDIKFSPARVDKRDELTIGSQVSVQAIFDGSGYLAQEVDVRAPAASN